MTMIQWPMTLWQVVYPGEPPGGHLPDRAECGAAEEAVSPPDPGELWLVSRPQYSSLIGPAGGLLHLVPAGGHHQGLGGRGGGQGALRNLRGVWRKSRRINRFFFFLEFQTDVPTSSFAQLWLWFKLPRHDIIIKKPTPRTQKEIINE